MPESERDKKRYEFQESESTRAYLPMSTIYSYIDTPLILTRTNCINDTNFRHYRKFSLIHL